MLFSSLWNNKPIKCVSHELRKIKSVMRVLIMKCSKTLVTSIVLSRLHYCNSWLSEMLQQLIYKLQSLNSLTDWLIFKTFKHIRASSLFAKLYWQTMFLHGLWRSSPVHSIHLIAFLCWHAHLSDSKRMKTFQEHRAFPISALISRHVQ